MSLTPLNPLRYVADSKRAIAEFINTYINGTSASTDITNLFTEWGGITKVGVDVYTSDPGIAADEELAKPRVIIALANDDVTYTWANTATTQNHCEYHLMKFEITCVTDEATGSRITCDDLATAVQRIFALYTADLESIGFSVLYRSGSREEEDNSPKIYYSILSVDIDVKIVGQAARVFENTLGSFVVTGSGVGTYTDGVTVDTAQDLYLKTNNLIGATAVDVTVTALDNSAVVRILTATIPPNSAAGTQVSLVPDVSGKKYKNVTNISIGAATGNAGDSFKIVNLPAEL